MANIKKSFNFRNGVQVDDDNFIVNPNGLVGIGSTIPTESLDVQGNIRLRGTLYADNVETGSIGNTSDTGSVTFNLVNVGITSITSGIISASSGIVTYYGDGSKLQGLPTSQWVDVNPALNGYTSIYAVGNVGIATTNPIYTFQVGGNYSVSPFLNGVGIDSTGNIFATGNITIGNHLNVTGITTSYSFSGFGTNITGINAENISNGTLDNTRLPNNINKTTGIITANSFYGSFVGIATTARNLTTDANIDIISIVSDYSNLGITTITTLDISNSIGVGTENPNSDFHLRKSSNATIEVTSDNNAAKIVVGREVNNGSLDSFGIIRFGNTDINENSQSTQESLDIINYAPGNVNYYIRPESTSNLKFNWINYSTNTILASLTPLGRLGIGKTNPNETFEVVGTSTVTNTSYFGSNVYISGSLYPSSLTVSGTSIFNSSVGIKTNSPSYDFQVGGNPNTSNGLSITNDGNLKSSGIITASSFSGSGSNLTNINASNISSGTISGSVNVNTTGIVTAASFSGSGSNLTNINASNISSGTISGSVNVNTTGIITAASFNGELNPSNITDGLVSSSVNFANSVGVGTTNPLDSFQVNFYSVLTGIGTLSISAGVSTFFESYEIGVYSSAEYLVSLNLNSNYQTQKIIVMNTSSSAFSTEHSILFNSSKIGTFGVSVSSGEVQLNMVPESGMTGILTYRFIRNAIVSWNP